MTTGIQSLDASTSIAQVGGVEAFRFSSPSGIKGSVVNRAFSSYTNNGNLTATIPLDDTKPQITEGTEIISLTYTMKSVTNRLRLSFNGTGTLNTAGFSPIVALFLSSSGNDAIAAAATTVTTADFFVPLVMTAEVVPAVLTPITISVRAGPSGAFIMRMNGNTTSRFLGGSLAATLTVEEIAP